MSSYICKKCEERIMITRDQYVDVNLNFETLHVHLGCLSKGAQEELTAK